MTGEVLGRNYGAVRLSLWLARDHPQTKDPSVEHHDDGAAERRKADCPWLPMSLAAHSASSGEFSELKQHVNASHTISCYLAFYVQPCQMTSPPRTEDPSPTRWQRLKLACPWFVHDDEQIMFLHVYWLFCHTVHPAFQDRAERTCCLLVTAEQKKQCPAWGRWGGDHVRWMEEGELRHGTRPAL